MRFLLGIPWLSQHSIRLHSVRWCPRWVAWVKFTTNHAKDSIPEKVSSSQILNLSQVHFMMNEGKVIRMPLPE